MASAVRDAMLAGAFQGPDYASGTLKGFQQGKSVAEGIKADRLAEDAAGGDMNALMRLSRYDPRGALTMGSLIQSQDQAKAQEAARQQEQRGRYALGWLQTPPEQRGQYLMQTAQEIQGQGGDVSFLAQFAQMSPDQQELAAQNAVRAAVDYSDLYKQAFPERKDLKPTGNMQDFAFYRQLQETDPAAADEFAIQAGIKDRPGSGAGAPKPTTAMQNFDRWVSMPEGPQKDAFARAIGIDPKISPAEARKQAEARVAQEGQLRNATEAIGLVDSLLGNDEYMDSLTGVRGATPWSIPGGAGYDAETMFDQLTNMLTLDNLEKMSGVLSDSDIKILRSAASGLKAGMSRSSMEGRLKKIRSVLQGKEARIRQALASDTQSGPQGSSAPAAQAARGPAPQQEAQPSLTTNDDGSYTYRASNGQSYRLPARNEQGWRLMIDGNGNAAYVNQDGTQYKDIR